MAAHIERRKFLATLGGAATWPLAARAQPSERMRRIGVLMGFAEGDAGWQVNVAALRAGLQELGWIDGRNGRNLEVIVIRLQRITVRLR
jgi:putative ABC transport system substrate-binding protein